MKNFSDMNVFELTHISDNIMELMEEATEVHEVHDEDGNVISSTEIFDEAKFAQLIEDLEVAKDEKKDGILQAYKNISAFASALKAEEKKLSERRKKKEKEAERLKNLASFFFNGEKYESVVGAVSWRKSEKLETENEETAITWLKRHKHGDLVKTKIETSFDSKAVKALIKSGIEVKGVALVENNNIQIK